MVKYQRRSEIEWQRIIEQQKVSGLKAKIFCEQQALSVKTFYKYRRDLQVPPESKSPIASFIKIAKPSQQPMVSTNVIGVLHYTNSRLHIHSGCDEKWLAKLLRALS